MQQQIKSVEKYRFNTFSDNDTAESVEITGFLMSRILFDKNGNIIETKTFDSDEEVEEHIQYIYNEAGLKTEEILYDQDEIAERHKFIYDDNNLILEELIYYQDDVYDTLKYDYDAEKRIVKRTLVDSDNDIESVTKYVYKNGKLIQESKYIDENELVAEQKYEFNEKGLLIKTEFFDLETEEKNSTEYEYDDADNKLKELVYNNVGELILRNTYTYNDKNKKTTLLEEGIGKYNCYTFEYDEEGNAIKQI